MKQIPHVKIPGVRTLSAPEMNRMPFDTGKRSEVPANTGTSESAAPAGSAVKGQSIKGATSLKTLDAGD